MNDFKTFIDSNDIDKINEFCSGGFYIADTMLVMEADLPLSLELKEKYCDRSDISFYDTEDLNEYLKANGKGFGTQDPKEQVLAQLSNPDSAIYVLRSKKKIASSITVWSIDEETVATENIFTIPSCREKGYAARLLCTALADASEKGKTKSRLTVYADDTPAINMYYKFGYKITRVLQEFSHE